MSDQNQSRLSRAASPVEVTPPHDSLVAAIEAAARARAPFFTLHASKGPTPRTPEQALEAAWRWAKLFAQRGVRRGDCIPILLPTSHAFVEAMIGAMLAGAAPVPLASPMTFGSVDRYLENLTAIAEDCGARLVVAHGRVRDAIAKNDALRAKLGDVVGEDHLDGVASTRIGAASIDGRAIAFLQYTSGTTGRPKGAVISHRALVSNAFAIARGLDLGDSHVGVSWLPLFHDMGLIGVLLTSICHPYPLHVMTPESFVMNPKRWLDLIAKVGGTLSAAPNFAYDLCVARGADLEDARLDTWRIALNGAEPVHKTTAARFHARYEKHGYRADAMMPVYGMAEATLAVTFPSLDAKMQTLGDAVSVGRPVAGMRVEVTGDDGRVLPEGEVGEIRVAGPSLMDGYYRDDAKTAEAIWDGWLRTGDLGFMHDGRLFVTGRAKDLIIKGGKNIYPHDLERVAGEVAGVRQGGVAAFGRANAETGTEDIVIVVETTHADAERREAIAKGVRAELLSVLGVKADDVRVCAVGQVPRTTSGKIRRRECARRVLAGELG